jgi:quercetin dioxygenase-like cupin family protein
MYSKNADTDLILAEKIFGKKPAAELKAKVMAHLFNLSMEEKSDKENLPLINKYSEANWWQKLVKDIAIPSDFENIYLHPLREESKIHQFVAWAKLGVPDENHPEMQESFLILEGACRCQIGSDFFEYQAGDFFEIPLHTDHNLTVISPQPVKVILQRVYV